MLSIRCTRCDRRLFSAARPRPGVRCPVCHGPLEPAEPDPADPGLMPAVPPPVQRADEGSYRSGFASVCEFVLDDVRRARSQEDDVGLRWLDAGGRAHRAAWVEDTGELTLIQLGPPEDGGGHVEVLGAFTNRADLNRELDGWRERCGRPDSAEWLRERAGAPAAA